MNPDYTKRLEACITVLEELIAKKDRTVLAIDGRCASGKTTAANIIAERFGGEVIHMDDFFLPPELRTPERLSEIGGNLHRERFISEVIEHIRDAAGFSYRVFECSAFGYADAPRVIPPARLIICEGSYALHPAFGKYYDLAVFSDITPDEQIERIRRRNGDGKLEMFRQKWIPMEERYFDGFGIRERCDIPI